jgi:hypothetical protein
MHPRTFGKFACWKKPYLLRARYRFGQDSINFIANLLREDLVRTTNKATGLTVEEQVS